MVTKKADTIIVGGGICGLVLALLCAREDISTVLIDRKVGSKTPPKQPHYSAWVSALNRSSEHLLEKLNVWDSCLEKQLAASYQTMHLCTTAHDKKLQLAADIVGAENLGHIVDNKYLKALLWQKAHKEENVYVVEASPEHWDSEEQILTTSCKKKLLAPLLIGSDGHSSWVREQANIPLTKDAISEQALVGICTHAIAHQREAKQCFFKDAILASLPLWDPYQSVLVYSSDNKITDTEAEGLLYHAAVEAFIELQPQKVAAVTRHPIISVHAQKYYQNNCILLGDAAMSLHPLAGLGLNCGLQAASILADKITAAFNAEKLTEADAIGRAYENAVLGYNAFTQASLNTIHGQLRTDSGEWNSWLSCLAFSAAQNSTFIKKQMIQHALYGLDG